MENELQLSAEKLTPEYKLRHSLAHIMAQAVLQIRPAAKLGFGPPVENGFYYDFEFGGNNLGEDDLKDIEKRMKKIIGQRQEFTRSFLPLPEAETMLNERNQNFKVEYARELEECGKAVDGKLSFYTNGPFVDMCEGPHLEHTGQVPKGCFKLDKIAGSYWRGDEKRPMLTRIYGLAFQTQDELKDYLARRELALQRDHRKLGQELEIFLQDDDVGVGLPIWLPNGTIIRDELETWAKEEEFKRGYVRVSTPVLAREQMYYRSGHLPYFKDSMFPPMEVEDDEKYYLRPMNCPHHHKVYGSQLRSYRDLPLRVAEYGNQYRYEKHGSLAGLLRVRAMCLNDAHIYCREDQVKSEFRSIIEMYDQFYQHLRMGNFRAELSLHDPDSEKFAGNEEQWTRTEIEVREILEESKIEFTEQKGEAAFYGPKMDIQVKNLLGREETVSTCQLDFLMAERFDLTYTDSDGKEKRPLIIHRAPLSTHERLISFLMEFYGGAFPTWMAPVQVRIIPVSDHVVDYARQIEQRLRERFFRVEVDDSSETFNKRIRKGVTRKIPNLWIIGSKEAEEKTVTWRRYCIKEQFSAPLDASEQALLTLRGSRLMDNFSDVQVPI